MSAPFLAKRPPIIFATLDWVLDSNWRLCPIDYAPFIHNLFDGSLINICPRRAYLPANSDTGVTSLSAASAGEFP